MKKICLLFQIVMFLSVSQLSAQDYKQTKQKNIFESLAEHDSVTNASVTVRQDKRIEQLITATKGSKALSSTSHFTGYRVQVFSSNTQRTAKAEAFNIEKQIREAFPYEEVYVNYISPFWKVRVGDFSSREKAEAFRAELIEAFPDKKSDTYIVREQINYNGTKQN